MKNLQTFEEFVNESNSNKILDDYKNLNEGKESKYMNLEWLKKFIYNDESIVELPGLSDDEDEKWRDWVSEISVKAALKLELIEEEDLQMWKNKIDYVASSDNLLYMTKQELDAIFKEAKKNI